MVNPIDQSELVLEDSKSQYQMPQARFIENVESFVGNRTAEEVVSALQDLHSKYKYLESGLTTQKHSLKTKLPDIESALAMVQMLQKKAKASGGEEDLEVTYNISENIYVQADVPMNNNTILLWLGASTLLEYTYDEAEELLKKNKSNAVEQLAKVTEEAFFVRDQIVTAEVNVARCHNFGVLKRQKSREEAKERENKEVKD